MIETIFALIETSRGLNTVALAIGSFVVYALASNLAARPFLAERLGALETSRSVIPKTTVGALLEVLRFGFYLGAPFVALLLGWIDVRAMGLGQVDWAEGLRWAIVILLAAWLLLMVIWLPYLRATADVFAAPNAHLSFARRIVELIYMQAHWAFYRAAMIVFFQGVIPDALYWGAAFGLALIYLEAFTNPRIRRQLARLGEADSVVWNAGQGIINALAFIVTRNFYLLVLIHFLLEVTVPHLRAAPSPQGVSSPPLPLPQPQRVRE